MKIDKSIGHLLNNTARLARQDMGNRIQELGLTFPQWLVLKDLASHRDCDCCQVTMAAIARRLNTRRPNILGILDRLEILGLVQRTVNPHNRRAHIVSLTGKAQDTITQLQEFSRLTTAKAMRGFRPEEETILKEYLARISNNLNTATPDEDAEGLDSLWNNQSS